MLERLPWLSERAESDQPLSEQQRAILHLLSEGFRTRDIARHLGLSEHTIKGYIRDILQRLGVHNRIEAVMLANRNDWL